MEQLASGGWEGIVWKWRDDPKVEVLQRHRRKAPVQVHLAHRSGKRGRSPLPQEHIRMGRRRRGGKASSKRAKAAEYATLDDEKKILTEVDVQQLRYSQLSIKAIFQCGRPVVQLVQDLWDGKVKVCAPFLRLSVFETTDPHTNQPILRCIDNRRLYALKQYALLWDDPVRVQSRRSSASYRTLAARTDLRCECPMAASKEEIHERSAVNFDHFDLREHWTSFFWVDSFQVAFELERRDRRAIAGGPEVAQALQFFMTHGTGIKNIRARLGLLLLFCFSEVNTTKIQAIGKTCCFQYQLLCCLWKVKTLHWRCPKSSWTGAQETMTECSMFCAQWGLICIRWLLTFQIYQSIDAFGFPLVFVKDVFDHQSAVAESANVEIWLLVWTTPSIVNVILQIAHMIETWGS